MRTDIETLDLEQASTSPTYLIYSMFGDEKYRSTNGDITIDGQLYSGGEYGVSGMNNWTSARVRFPATTTLMDTFIGGTWRGMACKIYLMVTANYPQIWEEGYAQDGYAEQGFTVKDPALLLDGVMVGGAASRMLEIDVMHKGHLGQWTPRFRVGKPVANHLPPAGTQISWGGVVFTLEAQQ